MTRGAAVPAILIGVLGMSGAIARAETDPPAFLEVSVTPTPVRIGSPVTVNIVTTPDVVSVQGHVATFHFNVPKTGEGCFSATGTVPHWARLFFHGRVPVHFVAQGADGARAETTSFIQM
jgi:hypothetical protein